MLTDQTVVEFVSYGLSMNAINEKIGCIFNLINAQLAS